MKKAKTLFLIMCIGVTLSFLLCGYSLIKCFVMGIPEEDVGSHIFEMSYLFLHLIICAILFYLSFRAMKFGSFFYINVMSTYEGSKNTTKQIIFLSLSGVFLLLGIYSTLEVFGANLPLYDVLGQIVWHDIMNASYLIFIIFLTMGLYPEFGPLLKAGD